MKHPSAPELDDIKNLSARELSAALSAALERARAARAIILRELDAIDRDRIYAQQGYDSLQQYLEAELGVGIARLEELTEDQPLECLPAGIRAILEANR